MKKVITNCSGIMLGLIASGTVMAHSGEHSEGALASILHSVTSPDHLWVAIPAAVVTFLALRKVLRAQKK